MKKLNDESLLETIAHGDVYFPMEVHQSKIGFNNPILNTHWHRHMEISLVEKGTAIYTVDTVKKQVKEGDILLIAPEALHSGQAIANVESENLTIVFDPIMLCSSMMDICTSNYMIPIIRGQNELMGFIESAEEHDEEMVNSLKKIRDEYIKKDIGYEIAIKKELSNVILLIYRNGYILNSGKYDPNRMREKKQIRDALQYIDQNFQSKIYVEAVAKQIGYSTYHFSRIFKAYTGSTFIEYVNNIRIHKAADLLVHSNIDITTISLEVGFNDVSYFVKKFKSMYNVTPTDFRNNFNSDDVL